MLPAEPQLDAESFEASTRYDALNRPVQSVAPHSNLTRVQHPYKINVFQPVFNEANLLERVDVWLERAAEPAALLDPNNVPPSPVGVANIDYDAKGQRQRIDYKNGASTLYSYDPLTFRLTQLLTRRNAAAFPRDDPQPPVAGWPGRQVQNLSYTHDPAGNITHIQDDAQQIIYFRNKHVEPSNDYTYDALYRLIQASGREHLGQTNAAPNPPTPPDAFNAFHTRRDHPGDGNVMGTFIERYVYDAVGNFLQMQHRGSDPTHAGWTRAYDYLEASLIEGGTGGAPLKTSNRLSRTTLSPNGANPPQVEPYQHDAHGNMVRMPHLGGGLPGPNLLWDYKDQLRQIDLGGGGAAFYVYDTSGQRVRKVWEKAPGLTEERIYLGGLEIFRMHNGPIGANTATLERETLHVMDDKQRIALVETRTLDPAGTDPAPARLIRYQFSNHLGSAILEMDEQARIISYEEYAPYGSSTYQAVRSRTETPKRYRYTGKERDGESGLSYHGARYYAPWLGRWTSGDPSGLLDNLTSYAYARGRPTILVDANGRQSKSPEVKINDVVPYQQKLVNRDAIGANPQKDHVISQGKQHTINPKIDTSKQLTVVQETGAARGGAPAKPHTQVTFHGPRSDVAQIRRIRSLTPDQWTSFEEEIVSPSLKSRYEAGYSESSTNIAAVDEIGSMFELDQPNRLPNSSSPRLDWNARTPPKGPAVDLQSGRVVGPAIVAGIEPSPDVTAPRARATERSSERGATNPETMLGVGGALLLGVFALQLVKATPQGRRSLVAGQLASTAVDYAFVRAAAAVGMKAPGWLKVPVTFATTFAAQCVVGGECNPVTAAKVTAKAAVDTVTHAYSSPKGYVETYWHFSPLGMTVDFLSSIF